MTKPSVEHFQAAQRLGQSDLSSTGSKIKVGDCYTFNCDIEAMFFHGHIVWPVKAGDPFFITDIINAPLGERAAILHISGKKGEVDKEWIKDYARLMK